MADKYIGLDVNGQMLEVEAADTSTGVAEAGDIVALDATGRIDPTLLPSGIGADQKSYEYTEAAAQGDLLNIFDDGGTAKVRLADATNGRRCHCFAPSAVLITVTAAVQFEAELVNQTGLTLGGAQFLGAAGAMTEVVNVTTGQLLQEIGVARDATTVDFEPQRPVIRA